MHDFKTLIILGNGADLHSGLKTTFKDFMEYNKKDSKINEAIESFFSLKMDLKNYIEKEKMVFTDTSLHTKIFSFPIYRLFHNNFLFDEFMETCDLSSESLQIKVNNSNEIENCSENIINEFTEMFRHKFNLLDERMKYIKQMNLWEVILILINGSKNSWYDVEKCMEKFFSMQNIISNSDKTAQEYIDESISKIQKNKISSIDEVSSLGYKYEFLIFYILYKNGTSKNNKFNAQDLLLNELYSFENKFSEYIYNETHIEDKNDSRYFYYPRINRLIQSLMNKSKNDIANILNFNYTSARRKSSIIDKENNIHGHIQNKDNHDYNPNRKSSDIILGIDTNINTCNYTAEAKKNIYKFTKTSRLLNKSIHNHTNILDDNIDEIIFYGHSLGESDYSYFQSIFDNYKLYDSELSLIFAFSTRKRKSESQCIESQSERISSLINRYGETLDNKDHAKNLLHKLLIENRLHLVKIANKNYTKTKKATRN